MADVTKFRSLIDKLKTIRAAAPSRMSVIVGYTANYALYVHENVEMKGRGLPRRSGKGNYWDPPGKGQAKFLEQPARTMAKDLAKLVEDTFVKTHDMEKSLIVAGLRLQRESQQLVPVDTGALKASAFTKREQ